MEPVGSEIPVFQQTGTFVDGSLVKALPSGGFVVAVSANGGGDNETLLATYSATGELMIPPTRIGGNPTDDQIIIDINVLIDGRYKVTWVEAKTVFDRSVRSQIFDPRAEAVEWKGKHFNEQFVGTRFGDKLNGATGHDKLWGEAGADELTGEDGNDVLNGGAGGDRMIGGIGDDTYYVDSQNDVVEETDGTHGVDQVMSTISYALGAHMENLVGIGSGTLTLTGNALHNTIVGNSAANRIDGGLGADQMSGGAGNDTYYVDDLGDRVIEPSTGGTADLVITGISFSLEKTYVERLIASGTGSVVLKGSSLSNTIEGNVGANKLYGGKGNDVLHGGKGRDVFVFDTKPSSKNADKITDFNVRDDRIYLDNADFKGVGKGTFIKPLKLASKFFRTFNSKKAPLQETRDDNDRVFHDKGTGKLYIDQNGKKPGGLEQFGTVKAGLALTAADFMVI